MCNWEHQYCEYHGLEFIIHYDGDGLCFDVDYHGELFLLDLGDELEVTT